MACRPAPPTCWPSRPDDPSMPDAVTSEADSRHTAEFLRVKALAERGVASAQHSLAMIYEGGKGVAQDIGHAIEWYRRAAEQNYARSQFNLALRYDSGQGVARDVQQAIHWFRKAAEQGYAPAQFNL